MAGHLILHAAVAAVLCAAGEACAQAAPMSPADVQADPTRPPAFLVGTPGSGSSALSLGPVLQSVLYSPERKAAIISGEQVELGGRFGQSKLVRLTDSEAVLEGPQGRTLLRLVPGIEKMPAGGSPVVVKPERKSSKNNASIPQGAGR